MNTVDIIRNRIQELYRTNPVINIDVSMSHPKVRPTNQEAIIKEVYPHIFRISTQGKLYSIQYTDILIKAVRIAEPEG